MRPAALIAAAALGTAAYVMYRQGQGSTIGDTESNIVSDTLDTMKSTLTTDWPTASAPYQNAIQIAADGNGVPVLVLAWLLWKESRYNPAIISGAKRSPVGALGIAQFMPATADEMNIDPLDPFQAIPAAAQYLARLHNARGSWSEALAAYNWGIGNVSRKGLAKAPPETVDYYTTILARAGLDATA
jgi:soluble lytic murein transglycosylase-like protein